MTILRSYLYYSILACAALCVPALLPACATRAAARQATPAAANLWSRPSSSAEISAFLHQLAARHTGAAVAALGSSVLGQPLEALVIPAHGRSFAGPDDPQRPLTFFLLGTQHGMEPSGGEALMELAAELAAHPPDGVQFIIMPNMNPDGRDRNRRVNANKLNLSTDFLARTQPETRAVCDVLQRFHPHVMLDVHESAALKKQSLGAQGFLIDFEAQFEPANHPNVHPALRAVCFEALLPATLAAVTRRGLPAQRYIGEITSTNQILTHGGASLRNVRNMAGLLGVCAFLLENKLDPSTGVYPTPRNLQARTAKQALSIRAFLDVCRAQHCAITGAVACARAAWDHPAQRQTVFTRNRYQPDMTNATRAVPLVRISDNQRVMVPFRYHAVIEPGGATRLPDAYRIPAAHGAIHALLARHGYAVHMMSDSVQVPAQQPGGMLLPVLLEPQADGCPYPDELVGVTRIELVTSTL